MVCTFKKETKLHATAWNCNSGIKGAILVRKKTGPPTGELPLFKKYKTTPKKVRFMFLFPFLKYVILYCYSHYF